ncbi:iron-sulfur cluster assembly protein [Alteribacillus sp. YIM 98480]|uniref:iron-sulfur cluster assembly protein n=1 Tax=Alteribacillus sp. YIM 98480 TaxID=2606599 RepID=UPI00131B2EEA|nr:iron-sulfur cluster assembly protein [Alteribacillus sp. YIM 98480]
MFKIKEVYDRLELVTDPEIDRPLPELGFIEDVEINGKSVMVGFRLPTYWCSPNFAFIMAEDIRDEVSELPWVTQVEINLIEHSESEKVNRGVNSFYSFEEMFSDKTDGTGLNELRHIFKVKAFYGRQERLLRYLLKNDRSKEDILELTKQTLIPFTRNDRTLEELMKSYLNIREKLNLDNSKTVKLITDEFGKPLTIEQFNDHLLHARRSRLTMEFNGHYCQTLLQTRYSLS